MLQFLSRNEYNFLATMMIHGCMQLLRTMLSKKNFPQNSSRGSSTKRYIEDMQKPKTKKQNETEEKSNDHRSKWDKTDSECKSYLSSVLNHSKMS